MERHANEASRSPDKVISLVNKRLTVGGGGLRVRRQWGSGNAAHANAELYNVPLMLTHQMTASAVGAPQLKFLRLHTLVCTTSIFKLISPLHTPLNTLFTRHPANHVVQMLIRRHMNATASCLISI